MTDGFDPMLPASSFTVTAQEDVYDDPERAKVSAMLAIAASIERLAKEVGRLADGASKWP
jgi:hypothetical protein